ncbi:hypothetical protein JMJ77_0000985 [Colletotrichum scovillei]|uniref:Uncharacterized protein n=1 Tax=Colletotrichum scovillei TaxID=1209932 RepID=A0A9P7RCA8_9PEZI|nr:hypothetical protein JMJ77_0000985 [Colletotrichum scovillei]KAG7072203.1 hypothetical protein JMJ76_0005061 [Colletotrichum scovillei]KAG7080349.1 hypothetical protein JMJ78_0007445 [Colletotrichum scovillei]
MQQLGYEMHRETASSQVAEAGICCCDIQHWTKLLYRGHPADSAGGSSQDRPHAVLPNRSMPIVIRGKSGDHYQSAEPA